MSDVSCGQMLASHQQMDGRSQNNLDGDHLSKLCPSRAKVTTAGGKQFLNNAVDGPVKAAAKDEYSQKRGDAMVTDVVDDNKNAAAYLSDDINKCFLKTKGNNFKEYLLELSETAVIFSRPKSAKQQELKYLYSQFQCSIDLRNSNEFKSDGS